MNWKVVREIRERSWEFSDAKQGEKVDSAKFTGVVNSLTAIDFHRCARAKHAKPAETGPRSSDNGDDRDVRWFRLRFAHWKAEG